MRGIDDGFAALGCSCLFDGDDVVAVPVAVAVEAAKKQVRGSTLEMRVGEKPRIAAGDLASPKMVSAEL